MSLPRFLAATKFFEGLKNTRISDFFQTFAYNSKTMRPTENNRLSKIGNCYQLGGKIILDVSCHPQYFLILVKHFLKHFQPSLFVCDFNITHDNY